MFLKYFCKRSFKVHVGTTLKDPTESNDFTLWCNVNFSISGFDREPEVDCFRDRKLTKCSFSKAIRCVFMCVFRSHPGHVNQFA